MCVQLLQAQSEHASAIIIVAIIMTIIMTIDMTYYNGDSGWSSTKPRATRDHELQQVELTRVTTAGAPFYKPTYDATRQARHRCQTA